MVLKTMEAAMAIAHPHARLSISGLGWGFSAALAVLFVLCLLAALFFPVRLAHGWVALFSDAPVGSTRLWVEGLLWSLAAGWLIALVFGTVYNWIVARRALRG
jgi:ABC-type sulfate transport system permease component